MSDPGGDREPPASTGKLLWDLSSRLVAKTPLKGLLQGTPTAQAGPSSQAASPAPEEEDPPGSVTPMVPSPQAQGQLVVQDPDRVNTVVSQVNLGAQKQVESLQDWLYGKLSNSMQVMMWNHAYWEPKTKDRFKQVMNKSEQMPLDEAPRLAQDTYDAERAPRIKPQLAQQQQQQRAYPKPQSRQGRLPATSPYGGPRYGNAGQSRPLTPFPAPKPLSTPQQPLLQAPQQPPAQPFTLTSALPRTQPQPVFSTPSPASRPEVSATPAQSASQAEITAAPVADMEVEELDTTQPSASASDHAGPSTSAPSFSLQAPGTGGIGSRAMRFRQTPLRSASPFHAAPGVRYPIGVRSAGGASASRAAGGGASRPASPAGSVVATGQARPAPRVSIKSRTPTPFKPIKVITGLKRGMEQVEGTPGQKRVRSTSSNAAARSMFGLGGGTRTPSRPALPAAPAPMAPTPQPRPSTAAADMINNIIDKGAAPPLARLEDATGLPAPATGSSMYGTQQQSPSTDGASTSYATDQAGHTPYPATARAPAGALPLTPIHNGTPSSSLFASRQPAFGPTPAGQAPSLFTPSSAQPTEQQTPALAGRNLWGSNTQEAAPATTAGQAPAARANGSKAAANGNGSTNSDEAQTHPMPHYVFVGEPTELDEINAAISAQVDPADVSAAYATRTFEFNCGPDPYPWEFTDDERGISGGDGGDSDGRESGGDEDQPDGAARRARQPQHPQAQGPQKRQRRDPQASQAQPTCSAGPSSSAMNGAQPAAKRQSASELFELKSAVEQAADVPIPDTDDESSDEGADAAAPAAGKVGSDALAGAPAAPKPQAEAGGALASQGANAVGLVVVGGFSFGTPAGAAPAAFTLQVDPSAVEAMKKLQEAAGGASIGEGGGKAAATPASKAGGSASKPPATFCIPGDEFDSDAEGETGNGDGKPSSSKPGSGSAAPSLSLGVANEPQDDTGSSRAAGVSVGAAAVPAGASPAFRGFGTAAPEASQAGTPTMLGFTPAPASTAPFSIQPSAFSFTPAGSGAAASPAVTPTFGSFGSSPGLVTSGTPGAFSFGGAADAGASADKGSKRSGSRGESDKEGTGGKRRRASSGKRGTGDEEAEPVGGAAVSAAASPAGSTPVAFGVAPQPLGSPILVPAATGFAGGFGAAWGQTAAATPAASAPGTTPGTWTFGVQPAAPAAVPASEPAAAAAGSSNKKRRPEDGEAETTAQKKAATGAGNEPAVAASAPAAGSFWKVDNAAGTPKPAAAVGEGASTATDGTAAATSPAPALTTQVGFNFGASGGWGIPITAAAPAAAAGSTPAAAGSNSAPGTAQTPTSAPFGFSMATPPTAGTPVLNFGSATPAPVPFSFGTGTTPLAAGLSAAASSPGFTFGATPAAGSPMFSFSGASAAATGSQAAASTAAVPTATSGAGAAAAGSTMIGFNQFGGAATPLPAFDGFGAPAAAAPAFGAVPPAFAALAGTASAAAGAMTPAASIFGASPPAGLSFTLGASTGQQQESARQRRNAKGRRHR